jgi:peptidoglycan/xylan/chitin deacetylase (PgdA/CDA1 family)
MRSPRQSGGFVISLDFELHWGVRDHRTVDQYRENLLGARRVIPAILDLFQQHRIHATWATVGFLFYESLDTLQAALPCELPAYLDANLNPYAKLSEIGKGEEEDPFHFAPSLIRKILAHHGQEIGTHTLSHFYTQAPGPSLAAFRADIRSAKAIASQYGVKLKSIVFPRNQISRSHVRICAEEGLIAYRSIDGEPWMEAGKSVIGRAMRLAGTYLPLGRDGSAVPVLDHEYPIVGISQSRFLRPWNFWLRSFEPLRLKRIFSSMDIAARNNKIFHLWWHPHNFGANVDENMAVLTRIIEHYVRINREIDWPSLTMAEVAESIMNLESHSCLA